jgi:hypothetical protein
MRIKKFFEFKVESFKSLILPEMTYDEIAGRLNISPYLVAEFEDYLKDIVVKGKTFHGTLKGGSEEAQMPIFDEIENFDQYKKIWDIYIDRTHKIESDIDSNL